MNPLNPAGHVMAVSALAFGLSAMAQTAAVPTAKQEAVAVKVGDTWT